MIRSMDIDIPIKAHGRHEDLIQGPILDSDDAK